MTRPSDMWILRSTNGQPERILRVSATTPRTIGRGPLADYVVDAALLSRVHCRLSATDTGLTVEDLQSTNGTFVNDERIERSSLHTGDRLRVGRLEFQVDRR